MIPKKIIVSWLSFLVFQSVGDANQIQQRLVLNQVISQHNCYEVINARLKEWQIPGNVPLTVDENGVLAGEYHFNEKGSKNLPVFRFALEGNKPIAFFLKRSDRNTESFFDPVSCAEEVTIFKVTKGSAAPIEDLAPAVELATFSEEELNNLISQNTMGLIYIWSPHMPFSIEGLNRVQKISQRKNLPLKILVDPNAQSESLNQAAKLYLSELPRPLWQLKAVSLVQLGALNHFPVLALYSKGKLLPHLVPGLEDETVYESMINKLLGI